MFWYRWYWMFEQHEIRRALDLQSNSFFRILYWHASLHVDFCSINLLPLLDLKMGYVHLGIMAIPVPWKNFILPLLASHFNHWVVYERTVILLGIIRCWLRLCSLLRIPHFHASSHPCILGCNRIHWHTRYQFGKRPWRQRQSQATKSNNQTKRSLGLRHYDLVGLDNRHLPSQCFHR